MNDGELTTKEAMMRNSDKLRMGMKIRALRERRGMNTERPGKGGGSRGICLEKL